MENIYIRFWSPYLSHKRSQELHHPQDGRGGGSRSRSPPRSHAANVRSPALQVFAITGSNPLLATALKLHDVAMKDEYFTSRRLAPNVDFFSGLIYNSLGFPMDYYPVLFAVPRVVGKRCLLLWTGN